MAEYKAEQQDDNGSVVRTFLADVSCLFIEENYKKVYNMLPDFRREKADRLRFQTDKALSAGAWRLWMMVRENFYVGEEQPFNLSHSGKYVLCSVAPEGYQVGCDLETVKEFRESLARRFFCPGELSDIMSRGEEERRDRFYRYWVLKESFMKATRKGMALGLDTFEIKFPEEGGSPVLIRQPEEITGTYYYKEYAAAEAKIAVCSTRNRFSEQIEFLNFS